MKGRLYRTETPVRGTSRNIEVPTIGVVLVATTVFGRPPSPAPLRWRLGTFEKPPLDLELDIDGRLLGCQFVLQDERVPMLDGWTHPPSEDAVPMFAVDGWPADRYYDEPVRVSSARAPTGQLVLTVAGRGPVVAAYRPGPDLMLAVDAAANLAEIAIGPLDTDEWDTINSFSDASP